MNNEPVAYLVQYKDRHEFRWKMPEHLFEALAFEPLYTAPTKELTDNDIYDLGFAEAIGFDKGYKAATAKTLTDEEIEDCYQLWRSLSGDPVKLYQLFKLKEQEK